jgi:PBSX family phage terminase large subunit
MKMESSTPSLSSFNPLPQQLEILKDIRRNFDYTRGVHEVMLSGSVGSAKSLSLAHVAITHCLMYPGSRFGIGRLALPQLKATLCIKIREHLHGEGIDYRYNETTGSFRFSNGSSIPALSWSDANTAKLGSYEFSGFGIEELTETKDSKAYNTLKQRVGRLPHIPEQILISATNPDSPSHWAYKRIINKAANNDLIKVYYSNTFDNPHLPPTYTQNLLDTLDERMVRRMVYGEWLDLSEEVIYYAYNREHNYRDYSYQVNPNFPIHLGFDFNIGVGKPMSVCFLQYIGGQFHVFNEVVVEGMRTEDVLEEANAKGLFRWQTQYIVNGDATGRHNDTRSKDNDYVIIEKWLANAKRRDGTRIRFDIDVPRANPPIRRRHNLVNGVCCNGHGRRNLFVYKEAETVDDGLLTTKLKKGASLIEDDSARAQHITTGLGYSVVSILDDEENKTGVYSYAR